MNRQVVSTEQRHGVVLLQPEGSEVPERFENEQGDQGRVLEGDGEGPSGSVAEASGGHEEDAGVL